MKSKFIIVIFASLLLISIDISSSKPAYAECSGSVEGEFYEGFSGSVRVSAACENASQGGVSTATRETGCYGPDKQEIPCRSEDGMWNRERGCYARQHSEGETAADAADGDHVGVVMECTATTGFSFLYLAPMEAGAAEPLDPRVLAEEAVSRMDLSAIEIGSFPWTKQKSAESVGVVGWNVWMWVEDPSASTVGPISESASAGGYTVTATAEVAEVEWDMGNGDVVSCGKGTPYPVNTSEKDPESPDCGYVYTKDGKYQISATTHWQINWSGIGESGVIPMELTATGDITIAEIQVLNVATENAGR